MKVFLFIIYYIKLRLRVLFGFHRTINPLNLVWRWHQWNYYFSISRHHQLLK
jgi:hypothetical protein